MRIVDYKDKEAVRRLVEREAVDLQPVFEAVEEVIRDVRKEGDAALFKYTRKFDGFRLTAQSLRVSQKEVEAAYSKADASFVKALKHAKKNIELFHGKQFKNIKKTWSIETEKGVVITEKTSPLKSIGAYVPGGRASYPSTVLMTCIPARVAGVERVVVTSPPQVSDVILVACDICGVNEIYGLGGAQAVAALAYGTRSIKKVDKIVGPGNKYVTAAKLLVFGSVDIDMPAGPSEVLIIADSSADAKLIAADILAQAEHDPDAQCIIVTDSQGLVQKTGREIEAQTKGLARKEIIKKSLGSACAVITKDMEEAAEFANEYAPEHLEIIAKDACMISDKVRNAGAVFVGEYAPVAAGDYASGGNHVLPTGGAARFSSALGVRDFLRSYCVQKIGRDGLSNLAETIDAIARAESLDAHSMAVKKRFE